MYTRFIHAFLHGLLRMGSAREDFVWERGGVLDTVVDCGCDCGVGARANVNVNVKICCVSVCICIICICIFLLVMGGGWGELVT